MEILKQINFFRGRHRLPGFSENSEMAKIAQARAEEMARGEQPFSHWRTDGKRGYVSEIADGETRQEVFFYNKIGNTRGLSPATNPKDAERVVGAWIESPSHKEGLLDTDVTSVGFDKAEVGDTTVVVAVFTDKE